MWIGLALIAVFWPVNWFWPAGWSEDGLRTHWAFFPLWLGYCLAVDGLVARRTGSSLLLRNPRAYVRLFAISAPAWWLFEFFNLPTQNWEYLGRGLFSAPANILISSLSFSTVMPAVFGTAELAGTFGWVRRLPRGPRLAATPRNRVLAVAAGATMLVLLLAWPRYFFPFLWLSVYLRVEPLNVRLGFPALTDRTRSGDWRGVVALWTGVLICGFFWEMWNYLSFPKWIYHVPFVGGFRIFEMPLLGYGGYLPFAMELHALHSFVAGTLGLAAGVSRDEARAPEEKLEDWIRLVPTDRDAGASDVPDGGSSRVPYNAGRPGRSASRGDPAGVDHPAGEHLDVRDK